MKTYSRDTIRDILEVYERDFAGIADHLTMKGKTLADSLREQGEKPIWYDTRKAELKRMVKYLERDIAKIRGQKHKHYLETYSRQLTERAINNYIDFDPEYLDATDLMHYASELYDKYSAAGEAFSKRGFALRDFTSALVASLHEVIL